MSNRLNFPLAAKAEKKDTKASLVPWIVGTLFQIEVFHSTATIYVNSGPNLQFLHFL